jgi:large subunit ribosomal protein L9
MNVEVILKGPVRGLGAEADMVKVRPGYARNFLFPRGLAAPVSAASKRQLESLKKKRAEREASEAREAQEIAAKLARLVLSFELKQAEEGAEKLFGAITASEIAAALVEKGFSIERKNVQVAKPINHAGEHEALVDLGYSVKTTIKVKLTGKIGENQEKASKARRPRKSSAAVEEEGKKEDKSS